MIIVVAAARERHEEVPGKVTEQDNKLASELMQQLGERYGSNLNIVATGCDRGVGKFVRDYCIRNEVVFAEVRVKFEGKEIPRQFFANMFVSRNPALVAAGDEFYVFCGPNPEGIIERIIEPAKQKVGESRVTVYACPKELKKW